MLCLVKVLRAVSNISLSMPHSNNILRKMEGKILATFILKSFMLQNDAVKMDVNMFESKSCQSSL